MTKSNIFGVLGVLTGGVALILALVHFWAGPFAAPPSLETVVAEKAASIRQKTIDVLKGKSVRESDQESVTASTQWNADKITRVLTAVLGGLAFILAATSFINRESLRASASAAALGISAVAVQFIAMYAMALLVVLLIAAVLVSLGGS